MLAGVEDDERVGVAEAREHAREGVGAACVDGLGEQADDGGDIAGAPDLDQPDPVGDFVLEDARGFERKPALPDARWPGQRHQPLLAQQLDNLRQLSLATDERRGRAGEVALPRRQRDGCDRRILREDRLLEPFRSGPGSSPSSSASTLRAS